MPAKLLTVALLGALLAGAPPRARADERPAITYRTTHFELTTDCDPDTRAFVARRLEAFRGALDILVPAATGVALSAEPIRVLLFESPGAYGEWVRQHAPGLGHNGGYFDGATRTVVAYHRSNPLQLLFHEVSHGALGDVFGDPQYRRYARPGWPVWFDEGFAEYASSYEAAGDDLRFAVVHPARLATLVDALDRGRMVPLAQLLRGSADRFSGPSMGLWYAASWGLVDLLLAEPDLRVLVPAWVARLRAGDNGLVAFHDVFGPDLGTLERRLHARIRRLAAATARPADLVGGEGLDAWTVHEGGRWETKDGVVLGHGGDGWNYLTRALPPSDSAELTLEVERGQASSVGVVLGNHAVDDYPYHTLLDLGPDRAALRHILAVERLEAVVERAAPVPGRRWVPVRVALQRGIVSVWVDGRHVLSAPAGRPTVSLLGLYVQGGAARFRHVALAAAPGTPTGPAAAPPPRGGGGTPARPADER